MQSLKPQRHLRLEIETAGHSRIKQQKVEAHLSDDSE